MAVPEYFIFCTEYATKTHLMEKIVSSLRTNITEKSTTTD